jgi:hypothetical protein
LAFKEPQQSDTRHRCTLTGTGRPANPVSFCVSLDLWEPWGACGWIYWHRQGTLLLHSNESPSWLWWELPQSAQLDTSTTEQLQELLCSSAKWKGMREIILTYIHIFSSLFYIHLYIHKCLFILSLLFVIIINIYIVFTVRHDAIIAHVHNNPIW